MSEGERNCSESCQDSHEDHGGQCKVLCTCWMCSVSPVSVSVTVGVFPGLTLMWYHVAQGNMLNLGCIPSYLQLCEEGVCGRVPIVV